MPEAPTWIVTVSGERALGEVVADLAQGGFETLSVLAEIGVITGRCAAARVPALRSLPGVIAMTLDAGVAIGPPGAPGTW